MRRYLVAAHNRRRGLRMERPGEEADGTVGNAWERAAEEPEQPESVSQEPPSRLESHGGEAWVQLPLREIDREPGVMTQRRARLFALVLEARSVECRVDPGPTGWQVMVPAHLAQTAMRELRLYQEENRDWPPHLPPVRPMMESTLPTICVLLLLATFHNVTNLDLSQFGLDRVDWIETGNAHGSDILRGEWWRVITALTLHADAVHLVSNLALGGLFIVYLCRDLGSGLAWTLLLASGACGNLTNAYLQLPSHSSVGASTAVFAAVGMLGAITMTRYRHHLRRRWPLPVASALALLVLLGTEGERTDLGAHLFGFVFGSLYGCLAEWLVGKVGRPGRLVNALLALASASVVVFCWWLALTHSG